MDTKKIGERILMLNWQAALRGRPKRRSMHVREGVMKLVGVRGKEADDEMDAKRKDGLKQ